MSGALVLETQRTILRQLSLEDTSALGELLADPEVTKTYGEMRPLTVPEHGARSLYAVGRREAP